MPYIDPEDKLAIDQGSKPRTPGQLNYALTQVVIDYVALTQPSYDVFAQVTSAFELAKLEFWRRVIVPYEEGKMLGNGDAFPEELIEEVERRA